MSLGIDMYSKTYQISTLQHLFTPIAKKTMLNSIQINIGAEILPFRLEVPVEIRVIGEELMLQRKAQEISQLSVTTQED